MNDASHIRLDVQRWSHPFGEQALVKIAERSMAGARSHGRTLEDILEVMVMVRVQPTKLLWFSSRLLKIVLSQQFLGWFESLREFLSVCRFFVLPSARKKPFSAVQRHYVPDLLPRNQKFRVPLGLFMRASVGKPIRFHLRGRNLRRCGLVLPSGPSRSAASNLVCPAITTKLLSTTIGCRKPNLSIERRNFLDRVFVAPRIICVRRHAFDRNRLRFNFAT